MPQVQVIQPIQQQPKRLRVAAYARVSSALLHLFHHTSLLVEKCQFQIGRAHV